jgi:hypothetical protein
MKKHRKFIFLSILIIILFEVYLLWGQPKFKQNVSVTNQPPVNSCLNLENSQKLTCWDDLIDETLTTQGLERTFELFDVLFKTEPTFASGCHDFVHKLGEKAYFLFDKKQDFAISAKSSYCGYGFYHGFMETLLQKTGDMQEARSFCDYVDTKLKKETSDAGGACYHGIGHGTVDGSDPRAWGDPEAMIQPALELCEDVSNDEIPPPRYGKLFRCTSGAFNGLEILMDSSQYKLSPNKEDPFFLCRKQPAYLKEACYTQFVVMLMQVTGGDFEASAEVINTIPEDDYALPTLGSLVVEKARIGGANHAETVNFCRNLPARFHQSCIAYYSEGFLKYGPPQEEYKEALNFCQFNSLTEVERKSCYDRVLGLLRVFYSAEKSASICRASDSKYQINGCRYN